jgi:hypothetical protein
MGERSGRQDVPERKRLEGLARRACMVSTADAPARSLVKEELNIFSVGLSPEPEAEEKM